MIEALLKNIISAYDIEGEKKPILFIGDNSEDYRLECIKLGYTVVAFCNEKHMNTLYVVNIDLLENNKVYK